MRRVVVFMGGSRDTTSALQRALPGSVESLGTAGILVPEAGRRRGFEAQGLSHQPLTNAEVPAWGRVHKEVASARPDTVFLVVPGLLRLGGSVEKRPAVVQQLSALGDEVTLVSVVGDQLTLINEFYINQVVTWRTSKRLEGAAPRLLDNDLFAHERLLMPWHLEPAVRYVAVPLTEFAAGHPVAVVLRAAGVELDDDPSDLGQTMLPAPLKLGPIGVEANRLLSTYLRAQIPGFNPDDPDALAAGHVALARAQKLGWSKGEFWGWTRRAADRAVARFDESNQRFAAAVWGTEWTEPYPLDRPCTQVEFLDLDVAPVEQVQRYVFAMAERLTQDKAGLA